ncbi:DNA-binding MarR family transcriptional regulator [Ereboglobus sp. PH5-5]|uniref:MarR family winged helix-turn-helix transcriptional regulator n=1 Tax=unclassified Ereboglobus TaxID=2626932 RepID=UPI0024062D9C|nr:MULTISPECIES: MarR family transcriptional regulator [unclassified Ereboglobus]MDF9828265.1 DNA-binding MarR family transcriptional regulator [Ereboglobus sp. PH5-10]MDF9833331.1 DNA-binding MarR family transcriptional regulator [Ereboglobus sp. PH5-5]
MHITTHILGAAGDIRKAATRVFRRHGLSPAQFNVLNLLSDQPDGLSAGVLAEELVVDPSNVTGLVGRMKRDGLLVTRRSPGDARMHVARLSAKGRRLWEASYADYANELAQFDAMLDEAGVPPDLLKELTGLIVMISEFCRQKAIVS